MNQNLQQQLLEEFPEFFPEAGQSPTLINAYGIECGDGWYQILHDFLEVSREILSNPGYVKLKEVDKANPLKTHAPYPGPKLSFYQIKEKLGTLRIYYGLTQVTPPNHNLFDQENLKLRGEYLTGAINALITRAYLDSSRTCEITGRPGTLHKGGGWWKTLCAEEIAKR